MLVVVENVLAADDLEKFRLALENAKWEDGSVSAGSLSASVKQNKQLAEDDPVARDLGNVILRRLGANAVFLSAALPEKIYPPKFNKYQGGGNYGAHVDGAIMRVNDANMTIRTDISATLFLTDPDAYEGGELVIETQFGAQEVKLAAGDMVLYPSTSLHKVLPVTRGARVASFLWIQSMVRDDADRNILFDLDQTIQSLYEAVPHGDDRLVALTGIYNNLVRKWALV